MKQPDSVEMKKINYEKLFVANDHKCYYGNPADVFEAARDGKQNFYVMYPVRTPIFDMCRMVELVGNSNDVTMMEDQWNWITAMTDVYQDSF